MSFGTGVFLPADALAALIKRINGAVVNGRFKEARRPGALCNRLALDHGLPKRAERYWIDLLTGEFLV
jgi:hypothetical protein